MHDDLDHSQLLGREAVVYVLPLLILCQLVPRPVANKGHLVVHVPWLEASNHINPFSYPEANCQLKSASEAAAAWLALPDAL